MTNSGYELCVEVACVTANPRQLSAEVSSPGSFSHTLRLERKIFEVA
jgi:hypothetical protein